MDDFFLCVVYRALALGSLLMFVLVSSAVSAGLVMYAYYAECDPISLGLVAKRDQVGLSRVRESGMPE